jgi:diguanylate cyclase (GGDEF)-like protein
MDFVYALLIDPHSEDADLIQQLLCQQSHLKLDLIKVADMAAGKSELHGKLCDLLILHLDSKPGGTDLEDLSELTDLYPNLPIVVLTDITDHSFCYEIFQRGAQDFLIRGLLNEHNLFRALIGSVKRKKNERELLYIANHDSLTGLPNRRLFTDRLERGMKRFYRKTDRLSLAIMLLDIDDFKKVNDRYGHLVGDKVLAEVGSRLNSRLRKNDTVARLGGDEFVIILEGVAVQRIATNVAAELLEIISHPFNINSHQILITGSIGISFYPKHGKDVEALLDKADQAMYVAKKEKSKSFIFAE